MIRKNKDNRLYILLYDKWFNRFSNLLESRLSFPYYFQTADKIENIRHSDKIDVLISYQYTKNLALGLKNLSLIQIPGSGDDGIDYGLLSKHIFICNTKGHESSIVQYVLTMIFVWLYDYKNKVKMLKSGFWSCNTLENVELFDDLSDKKILIIGFGNIGKHLVKKLSILGAKISVITDYSLPGIKKIDTYKYVDLPKIIGKFDFIILCMKPSTKNKGLIDKNIINKMQKNSVLINIARAHCVNEKDLYNALKDNMIGGAILDVWYNYPNFENEEKVTRISHYPFHMFKNVICTPHSAGLSRALVMKRIGIIANNLENLYYSKRLDNRIR